MSVKREKLFEGGGNHERLNVKAGGVEYEARGPLSFMWPKGEGSKQWCRK